MDRIFKEFLNFQIIESGMTMRFACFEQLPLYSAKATHTCLCRIRDSREANIWLRSQASHLAKIFLQVCKSQVELGHTSMEIFLNLTGFTDFF